METEKLQISIGATISRATSNETNTISKRKKKESNQTHTNENVFIAKLMVNGVIILS